MMRVVLSFLLSILVLTSAPARAGDANLDPAFGTSGVAMTDVNPSDEDAGAVALRQSDGKLLAVGYAKIGPRFGPTVVRYDANGVLDTSFGTSGVAFANLGRDAVAADAVLQSDEKIVAAGTTFNSGDDDTFGLARFNTDGSIDGTFGTGGIVTTNLSPSHEVLYGLALQSDGMLVAAGGAHNASFVSEIALVRYDTNGVPDPGFGTGGVVRLAVGGFDFANDVAIQSDGKIVVAGQSGSQMVLARFETDGSLDTGFGSGGSVLDNFGGAAAGRCLLLGPGGTIVVAGQRDDDLVVARYDGTGAPDATFGTGGRTIVEVGGIIEIPTGIVRRADGHLVVTVEVVRTTSPDPDIDAGLVQLADDGTPDAGFGTGGIVTFGLGSITVLSGPLLQPDGKLVAAGSNSTDTTADAYRFLIARFGGDCGNGTVDAGEVCDDGNAATDDCCSVGCAFEPAGTSCQGDADACTADQCDGAGNCNPGGPVVCSLCRTCDSSLGCVPAPPASSCKQSAPGYSQLRLRADSNLSGRLVWKWKRGAQVDVAELGDPANTDDYELCFYTHQGSPTGALVFEATAPAGGTCAGHPCWLDRGSAGFLYSDREATPDGLTKIVARPGARGRALVRGDGVNLHDVMFFSPVPLPLRTQLRTENGLCLEATYSAAGVTINTGTRFKGRAD